MRLKTIQKTVDKVREFDPATDFNKSMLLRMTDEAIIPYEMHGNRRIVNYDTVVRRLCELLEIDTFGSNPPHIRTIDNAVREMREKLPETGISEERFRTLINSGKVASIRIGNRRYVAMEIFHAPYDRKLFEGETEQKPKIIRHRKQRYSDELLDDILKRGAREVKVRRV